MLASSKGRESPLPVVLRLTALTQRVVPRRLKRVFDRVPLLNGMIRRLLDQAAPPGMVEVVVPGGAMRGTRLKLNLKSEREYWLGTYERQFIPAVETFCKPGMTVYDLGANIGYTALVFARVVGATGKVFAFEPLPANVRRVQDHIALNALQHVIQLVPCAVSDGEGKELFFVHQSHEMGKLVGSAERDIVYADQIEVQSLRLDDFVYRDGNPAPDIVKIDIEGGGVKAIPGMRRILAERRPILLMELHGPEERQVAWDMLPRYRFYRMQQGYPEVTDQSALESKWRNHVVAVPND